MGPPLKEVSTTTTKQLNCFDKLKLLHKESSLSSKASLMKTLNLEKRVSIYQFTPLMPAFVKEGGSELDIIWTIKNEMFDRFRLTEAARTSVS